jgi:hypothetical protein
MNHIMIYYLVLHLIWGFSKTSPLYWFLVRLAVSFFFGFLEATGLKKGQGQRALFGIFKTHPTSKNGLAGGQQVRQGSPWCGQIP